MAKNSDAVDLFGLPVLEPKDRRGRKAHVRTPELSKKIALSRAMGRTVEEIAALVGLDPKTLTKYYSRELEKASELVEAILDEAIFEQAVTHGRVGAQRLLKEQLARGKAAVPLAKAAPRHRAKPAPPLGKKAQADEDAHNAHKGTAWAEVLKPH